MLRPVLVFLTLLGSAPTACWGDSLPPIDRGWVESSTYSGSTHYVRGNGTTFVLYHQDYSPRFPQIFRAHSYAVFMLPPREGCRLTDAYLCCYQWGVSGRLGIRVSAISMLPDSSVPAYTLYNSIVNGPMLSIWSAGVTGLNRRRLNVQGMQFLDSCRAQGWVVLTLVGADLYGIYDEVVNVDSIWLDLTWSTCTEEQPACDSAPQLFVGPNPAPSLAAVHLLADLGPQAEVVIVDAAGRVVRRLASGETAITGLRPGVYVVRVAGSSPPLTRKLVITP